MISPVIELGRHPQACLGVFSADFWLKYDCTVADNRRKFKKDFFSPPENIGWQNVARCFLFRVLPFVIASPPKADVAILNYLTLSFTGGECL